MEIRGSSKIGRILKGGGGKRKLNFWFSFRERKITGSSLREGEKNLIVADMSVNGRAGSIPFPQLNKCF